jgi:hypothetical protein
MNRTPKWPTPFFFTGCLIGLSSLAIAQSASPSLVELATKDFGWMFKEEQQFAERLGAIAFRGDRAAGTQDGLEFYTDPNTRKFDRWCGKQGGKVTYETSDAVMSKTAGFLWPAEATKEDASWVCHSKKDGTVIGAVLRGATREVQVPYWGGGKVRGYEFRYAIFDGPSWVNLPARRDEAFAAREASRNANIAAENAKWEQATARLRADPKVGDETWIGMIVEVKPPLALIQRKANRATGRGPSQEWLKIEELLAPR